MKYTIYFFMMAAAIYTVSCASSGSLSREERKALKTEQAIEGLQIVKAMLESGKYVFTAQSVQPTGGRTVQLNSSMYTIATKDNLVKANLPYFGRAYESHYTSEGGIKFEGEPLELAIAQDEKKNNILVRYKVETTRENFEVSMIISSSGYGSVNVISRSRQSISYYGSLSEMADDYIF